jgi:hypothetical protein
LFSAHQGFVGIDLYNTESEVREVKETSKYLERAVTCPKDIHLPFEIFILEVPAFVVSTQQDLAERVYDKGSTEAVICALSRRSFR